jgi:hypothetical protein
MRPAYDFIVCGSGSSGSVVAHCFAGNLIPAISLELKTTKGDES